MSASASADERAPRLIFRFPDDGVEAEAVMLPQVAPVTCSAIREGLPFQGLARHGIYSGSEVLLYIPPEIRPPRENALSRVQPGDIGFYSFEEQGSLDGRQPRSEIAWFYGPDARPSMADGPVAVNLFARFKRGTEGLFDLCHRMRLEGAKTLEVSLAG